MSLTTILKTGLLKVNKLLVLVLICFSFLSSAEDNKPSLQRRTNIVKKIIEIKKDLKERVNIRVICVGIEDSKCLSFLQQNYHLIVNELGDLREDEMRLNIRDNKFVHAISDLWIPYNIDLTYLIPFIVDKETQRKSLLRKLKHLRTDTGILFRCLREITITDCQESYNFIENRIDHFLNITPRPFIIELNRVSERNLSYSKM